MTMTAVLHRQFSAFGVLLSAGSSLSSMRKTVHSLLGGKRRSSRKGPDFTQTQLHPASRSLLQPVCKARKQHNFWTMRKRLAHISQVPLQFRCQLKDLQELMEMTTVIDPIRNSKDHVYIHVPNRSLPTLTSAMDLVPSERQA